MRVRNKINGEYMKIRAIAIAMCCTWLALPLAARAEPVKIKEIAEKQALAYPDNTPGRPSFLKTIRGNTSNYRAGELQKGVFCSASGDVIGSQKLFEAYNKGFFKLFRSELEKNKYPVPNASDSMFEEQKDRAKTENPLQVGAYIKEMNANLCVGSSSVTGGVYLKVYWQVYAPEAKKVVFETTTEGSYQSDKAEKQFPTLFENAFVVAARNMLNEPGYMEAVKHVDLLEAAPPATEKIKIKAGKAPVEALSKNITMLRSAVVTVFSDGVSGSGFFISEDGYVLTNRHVVGDAKFVKVKLPTGRELVGEVLRSDKVRDVALVKTEAIEVQALALRGDDINIGEDVYALGSPLGEKFSTSLTHGILSGYRTLDEQRFLQSDVAILPGNSGGPLLDAKGTVVGMTVLGLGAKGIAGMNFFIPVKEAINKLSIELN